MGLSTPRQWYVGEVVVFPPEIRKRLEFVRWSRLAGYAQFNEQSRSDDPTFDNRWLNEWPFKEAQHDYEAEYCPLREL